MKLMFTNGEKVSGSNASNLDFNVLDHSMSQKQKYFNQISNKFLFLLYDAYAIFYTYFL